MHQSHIYKRTTCLEDNNTCREKRSSIKMIRKRARRQQIEHLSQENIESIVYLYTHHSEAGNEKKMKANF